LPFFYGYGGRKRLSDRKLAEAAQPSGSRSQSNEGLLGYRRVPHCEIVDRGTTRKELRSEVQVFSTVDRLWQIIIAHQKIRASKDITGTKVNRRNYLNLAIIPFAILGRKGKLRQAELNHLILGSELGWKLRRFSIPGLYQRETLFQIVPHVGETGTTLVRTETFSGLLVPFLGKEIRTARRDIQLANMELKEKAENII
jgi:hypothetical protein